MCSSDVFFARDMMSSSGLFFLNASNAGRTRSGKRMNCPLFRFRLREVEVFEHFFPTQ